MIAVFYAVEVSLLKVTADVDEHGGTIPGTQPTQEVVRSHYDGTYPSETDATVTYDACEVVMQEHAAQRRTV